VSIQKFVGDALAHPGWSGHAWWNLGARPITIWEVHCWL